MYRILIIAVALLFLAGCGNGLEPIPPLPDLFPERRSTNFDQTKIGICSAGLSEGSKRALRAEFDRRGGELGFNWSEIVQGAIFSRDDISGSDKTRIFEMYIGCIESYHNVDRCNDIKASCEREYYRVYESCLEDARVKCIIECTREFGFPRNRCVSELCYPNSSNLSVWSTKRCQVEQEDFLDCEGTFRLCITE